MNRVRLITATVSMSQQGEVRFFELRLPNNCKRLLGLETDVFVLSAFTPPVEPTPTRLEWRAQRGICAGKLKLRTQGPEGIFFEEWVTLIPYGQGLPDMSFGRLPTGPLTIDRQPRPKLLNLPCHSLLVEGFFEDQLGARNGEHLSYELRLFLWIETDEAANGVTLGFDRQSAGGESNNLNLLQLKL